MANSMLRNIATPILAPNADKPLTKLSNYLGPVVRILHVTSGLLTMTPRLICRMGTVLRVRGWALLGLTLEGRYI